jgi:hypothetical protein
MIETSGGKISQEKLDRLIEKARSKYDIPLSLEEIRTLVIEDYDESDINEVTVQDIVEIIDASE